MILIHRIIPIFQLTSHPPQCKDPCLGPNSSCGVNAQCKVILVILVILVMMMMAGLLDITEQQSQLCVRAISWKKDIQVSNHGPVCSCPSGYQGDPLSQCFQSRRGWFLCISMTFLKNRNIRICCCWTFRWLLKTIALPQRHAIEKLRSGFNSFTRKIVGRRQIMVGLKHLFTVTQSWYFKGSYFLRSENISPQWKMHKYIRDKKLNCPRAYLPGAVLGWNIILLISKVDKK